jgi:membrane-associated phospholipid phosphatase
MFHHIEIIAKAAIAADVALFKIINAHHSGFFDRFFLFFSYLGNGWVVIPLFLVVILWRTPKSRRIHILICAAVTLSITSLSNFAFKRYIDRPRPEAYFVSPGANTTAEEGRLYEVRVVGEELHDHSFPSGHAQTVFAVATLAVIIFGRRFWPIFLAAMVVAYSRVYTGVHFPLDVVAGACVGSVIALVVWHGVRIIAPLKSS